MLTFNKFYEFVLNERLRKKITPAMKMDVKNDAIDNVKKKIVILKKQEEVQPDKKASLTVQQDMLKAKIKELNLAKKLIVTKEKEKKQD